MRGKCAAIMSYMIKEEQGEDDMEWLKQKNYMNLLGERRSDPRDSK